MDKKTINPKTAIKHQGEPSRCVGKERYPNQWDAQSAAKYMSGRGRTWQKNKFKVVMRTYHCEYCGGWHIGH